MKLSDYQYICSGGESWDSIALNVYGNEKYAAELICANPAYSRRAVFAGGESLRLPVIAMREDESTAMPVTAPWKE